MIDIDGYPVPPDADLVNHPEQVIEQAIRDLLPPEFHDANCFWQLSSSCGLVDGILKVHLFFWFDKPRSNKHLRRWMKLHAPYVDIAPFSANQPHFIADAKISGGDDPLTRRIGWLRKSHEFVVLSEITDETVKKASRERAKTASGNCSVTGLFARSVSEALSHMGDGERMDGFHRPLLAAGMAYARVCAKGRARDDKAIKDAMKKAIAEAPKRPDRGDDGVQEVCDGRLP